MTQCPRVAANAGVPFDRVESGDLGCSELNRGDRGLRAVCGHCLLGP